MPGHRAAAAAERRQVQPAGVPGGVAAERARGHGDTVGPAEGETLPLGPQYVRHTGRTVHAAPGS